MAGGKGQQAYAVQGWQLSRCDRESNIRMLTGTIKADWIQLPVERYLAALSTLRHGVIVGIFRNKGAAPWGITRAEKLQLSVFLSKICHWMIGMQGVT